MTLLSRSCLVGAVALACSAPAFADTLKEVTSHGQVMRGAMQGTELTFATTFAADGTYSTKLDVVDQTMTGKWRIDGDKLCTKGDANPTEDCTAYPANKKSGDTFEVDHPRLGKAKVTIN